MNLSTWSNKLPKTVHDQKTALSLSSNMVLYTSANSIQKYEIICVL